MVAEYKRQYADYKKQGGTRSYGSWVKWKGYGAGIGSLFDPRFISQGVLVPKPFTNKKFLTAFGKVIPQNRRFADVFKKTLRNYYGAGVDIHSLIGKLPAPQKGWTKRMVKALDAIPRKQRQ